MNLENVHKSFMKPSCKIFMSINVVKKKKSYVVRREGKRCETIESKRERDDEKCKQKKTFLKLQL